MAGGPTFVANGTLAASASAITLTPSLPLSNLTNAHGLLLAVIGVENNAVISTATSGWVKLFQDNSGVNFTLAAFIAPGNSIAPVFTWAGSAACSAVTAFYDDTGQPIVNNAIGAASVASVGTGTTVSSASINTTRLQSVVAYYSGINSTANLGTPATWTEDVDVLSGTSTSGLALGSKAVPVSGSASGAISVTATASGDWAQRQIELLIQSLPNNFYSVEFETTAASRISTGFESAEFETIAFSRIGTGFETAEVEKVAFSRISSGVESASYEICALTFEGEEPIPPIPEPEITKARSWGFPLDGHDIYVLRIGETGTAIFDLTTGEQAFWETPDRDVWRAQTGGPWLGRTSDNVNLATNIVVGDDTLGLLWCLDPEQPYDEADVLEGANVAFERVLTTVVPLRLRNTIPCDAVYLTVNVGEPLTGEEAFTLRTSDDNGRTWTNHGTVTLTAGDYSQEVAWRSLGLMKSPGRIFEITDSGASTRVSNFDIKFRGMANA